MEPLVFKEAVDEPVEGDYYGADIEIIDHNVNSQEITNMAGEDEDKKWLLDFTGLS
eukprot:CAMPEP_0170495366 /NCGR_PEP_ID=MMETSP0208-20121228/15165_1 /TAXON_ID=197538 /ORGANISM="Strombidium inclinatum, Strain S3" /LENGTH=55 /DNA_ID=CAMNT_0010771545 /DNA_START=864 /DNA_END=1031 /DNA_ORIENTATION=+